MEVQRSRIVGVRGCSTAVVTLDHDGPVVALSPPCGACPTQWFGATAAGEALLVHYRYGVLSVTVGEGTPVARVIFAGQVGGALDGVLGTADMRRHLAGAVDFAPILEDHVIPSLADRRVIPTA